MTSRLKTTLGLGLLLTTMACTRTRSHSALGIADANGKVYDLPFTSVIMQDLNDDMQTDAVYKEGKGYTALMSQADGSFKTIKNYSPSTEIKYELNSR